MTNELLSILPSWNPFLGDYINRDSSFVFGGSRQKFSFEPSYVKPFRTDNQSKFYNYSFDASGFFFGSIERNQQKLSTAAQSTSLKTVWLSASRLPLSSSGVVHLNGRDATDFETCKTIWTTITRKPIKNILVGAETVQQASKDPVLFDNGSQDLFETRTTIAEVAPLISVGLSDRWRSESISLLALSKLKGFGFHTMRALANLEVDFYDIVRTDSHDEFTQHLKTAKCKVSNEQVDHWFERRREFLLEAREQLSTLRKLGIRLIHAGQDEFPIRLADAPGPPKWLFVKGNVETLQRPMLGAVGTRKPTDDGLFLARYLGAILPLISDNFATVSGLAMGIDQIVHVQSIRNGIPTVAVLGTGILADYPNGTAGLKKEICDKDGAIITEYFPNESYAKENFVLRNRLQAALSSVLIPVEWSAQSGTAHTVRFAGAMKRQIICMRMPNWQIADHPEFEAARLLGGQTFSAPGEEESLLKVLRNFLFQSYEIRIETKQLTLFPSS